MIKVIIILLVIFVLIGVYLSSGQPRKESTKQATKKQPIETKNMSRLIDPFEQFFDGAGDPLIGGKLFFYESGSSTALKETYSDSGLGTPNASPVLLNGDGRCPNVFGQGSYRVILVDANDQQILLRDPVGGSDANTYGADWRFDQTYSVSDVVRDENIYWVSLTNNNLNNKPSSDGGSNWVAQANTSDVVSAIQADILVGWQTAPGLVGDSTSLALPLSLVANATYEVEYTLYANNASGYPGSLNIQFFTNLSLPADIIYLTGFKQQNFQRFDLDPDYLNMTQLNGDTFSEGDVVSTRYVSGGISENWSITLKGIIKVGQDDTLSPSIVIYDSLGNVGGGDALNFLTGSNLRYKILAQ